MPSHVRHRRTRRRSDHPCRRLEDRPSLTQPGSPRPAQEKFTSLSLSARGSSYSEFRRNLAGGIDRVNADREPLIITRDRGKPMAVLMSLEDFAFYEETRDLMRSAKNAERLMEAIGELERGGATERTIAE